MNQLTIARFLNLLNLYESIQIHQVKGPLLLPGLLYTMPRQVFKEAAKASKDQERLLKTKVVDGQ